MKSIVIIHDTGYADVDKMLNSIDYVAQHSKEFTEEFTLYCEPDSPLAPVLKESGLPFSTDVFPDEPHVVIAFTYDRNMSDKAYDLMINQWQSKRPVYPFMVVKPNEKSKDEANP